MPIQNVATSYTDHNAELASLDRQRQLALMLQNQSLQPMDNGQTAGGYFIPNHPTQGLAKMLQAYVSQKRLSDLDAKQKDVGVRQNQQLAEGLSNFQRTMQGTPEIPGNPMPPAELGGGPERPATPAVPGDRQAAFAQLLASGHPALQQFGMQQIGAEPERQQRAQEFDLRRQDTRDAREERAQQFGMMLADRQQGRQDQAELRRELAKSGGAGQSPYFQPVQTGQGVFAFNARTGTVEPVRGANGQPIIGAQADPSLQGNIAQSKASGKEMGESSAKSQIGLPQAVDTANVAIKQIDDLLSHPGFSSSVGATLRPFANKVDGTPEADFTKRLDQLKGGAFLQAFESLKGGGQITEVEGKKATDAITRMDKAQSETEFANAAREFQGVIRQGLNRAKMKAGTEPAQSSIDDLLNKYK